MSYKLFTDIGCDLPLDYIQKHELAVLPMTVTIEGREYAITSDPNDTNAIDSHVFYDKLRQGIPAHTAQINSEVYREHFEPVLRSGEDILYIAFSSGLSGSCNSASLIARELKEVYPERELVVVDSLCASLGQGLLMCMVVSRFERGMGLHELAQFAAESRQRVHHWVTVDDLAHLRRGGRVSGASALIGTVLSIKPIIMVDPSGKLVAVDKVQGRKRALKHLVDKMQQEARMPIAEPVLISHGDSLEDAKYVETLIRQRFGVDVLMMNDISPIIGCHSGPGTIALFFVSDKEREN